MTNQIEEQRPKIGDIVEKQYILAHIEHLEEWPFYNLSKVRMDIYYSTCIIEIEESYFNSLIEKQIQLHSLSDSLQNIFHAIYEKTPFAYTTTRLPSGEIIKTYHAKPLRIEE